MTSRGSITEAAQFAGVGRQTGQIKEDGDLFHAAIRLM
jgi:hypothetical protein